jgi:hypothetical protein
MRAVLGSEYLCWPHDPDNDANLINQKRGLQTDFLRITLVKHWFPVGIYSRDLNPLGRPTLSWVNGTNKAGLCRFPDWAGIRRTESADPSAL